LEVDLMFAAVDLGDLLWSLLVLFVMVHVLIATFVVIVDVLRSDDLSNVAKAAWMVALVVFPIVTLVVYLLLRGDGIGTRVLAREKALPPPPPPASATTHLREAKALLDEGAITDDEYARLKAQILG
jgi:hypothetical protein